LYVKLENMLNKIEPPGQVKVLPLPPLVRAESKENEKVISTVNIMDIDVEDDDNEFIKKSMEENKLNVNDEKVKNRWSRYIGAVGIESVAKQSNASIFLSGAGILGA